VASTLAFLNISVISMIGFIESLLKPYLISFIVIFNVWKNWDWYFWAALKNNACRNIFCLAIVSERDHVVKVPQSCSTWRLDGLHERSINVFYCFWMFLDHFYLKTVLKRLETVKNVHGMLTQMDMKKGMNFRRLRTFESQLNKALEQ